MLKIIRVEGTILYPEGVSLYGLRDLLEALLAGAGLTVRDLDLFETDDTAGAA